MAIRVGRLVRVGFAKRGAVPSAPPATGDFTTPTLAVRFLPPHSFFPTITPLESAAIDGLRELPSKVTKGPGTIEGFKVNHELEPSDVLANMLMAVFGLDTVTGDGAAAPHAHNFSSLQASQLPTYDWWHDEGDKQFGFAGMMASRADLIVNKAETIRLETEWHGLFPVEQLLINPTLTTPTVRPLVWAQVAASLAGSQVYNLGMVQVTIDNAVGSEHTLRSDTEFKSAIWVPQINAVASFEQFFENTVEYDKYRNAADPASFVDSSLELLITSVETFTEGALTQPFVFRVKMGATNYRTFEVPMPDGVIKASATLVGKKHTGTIGAGGNAHAYTNRAVVIQFVNGVVAPY